LLPREYSHASGLAASVALKKGFIGNRHEASTSRSRDSSAIQPGMS
jgi:hypothetical protein